MCENCTHEFEENEPIYIIYETLICFNKKCISTFPIEQLEKDSDNCFMTTYTSN
jgi:hypothetical protein